MCCSRWSFRTALRAAIKVTCLYVGKSHSKFITRITSVITHFASSTATESFWAWTPRDNVFANDFQGFRNFRKKFSEFNVRKKNRLKTFLNQFRFPITVQICIFCIVIEFYQILNEFWNFLWCHPLYTDSPDEFGMQVKATTNIRIPNYHWSGWPCSWRHSDFRQGCW